MPDRKPKLGQNFLNDPQARQRIVEALGDISGSTVLEIGPGRGALTNLLASRAHRLIAVELDRALAPRLTESWKHASHVRILQQDIVELDLATVAETPGETLVVVGNLPYYITSDILLHLFSHAAHISRAVVMVQNEVADRLAAPCGVSAYGLLSATAQMHARVEKLFVLPPEAFSPPPKVHSAVVRLDMHPRFEELHVERAAFLRFLQSCFQQKRKTLANNLKSAGIAKSEKIAAAIEGAGLEPAVRAEAVSLPAMARLFRQVY
ncbi:MAG: 16S rRNA (adenine(1518)-N(6)/adenine(1519)-N(6))-dimethyltransferase RsmA [Acidobacteriaceae bacterium]